MQPEEIKDMTELAPGTYKFIGSETYIYKKVNRMIVIMPEGIEIVYKKDYYRYEYVPEYVISASYNDVYKAYKKILKQTDEVFGTRGVLIKPDEIHKRVGVDSLDRVYIKGT